MFKIVFITDLHISPEGEFPLGVDLRSNLINCLSDIKAKNPELIIIGGDICLKGPIPETYKWVKKQFDALEIPYVSISGNHDDSLMLAKEFGLLDYLKGEELYYTKEVGDKEFIFLDTSSGTVSEDQMKWLKIQLQRINDRMLYVFMHHPPCLGLVPHMDEKHFLSNHEEVLQLLRSVDKPVRVFCGHYHTDRTIYHDLVEVYFTPSLYLQIKDDSSVFGVETYNPGFRLIEANENFFFTKVYYLPAARFD